MTKIHYPQKLLLKARDASNMYLSHIKVKEYWETHDTYEKSVPYILKKLNLTRFTTVHDFCASHGANIPYILSRNKANYGIAHDIHPSKASNKLWSYYPRITARMEYRQEDIHRTEYNLEDNSLVMGIHACRELSLRICDIAVQNKLPIVLVPCCIGSMKDSLISKFEGISKYTRWCISIGEQLYKVDYNIHVRYIRKDATPVGTILIGIPIGDINE